MDLIYCSGGNRKFMQIAVNAGFLYGAQLPDTVYPGIAPLHFADQDWRKPDRTAYMTALAKHHPRMATVLDWEFDEQLDEVLAWAEEAAQYVEIVLIVPKVIGGIARLPRRIGGVNVHLAYSVPTRYAGTCVPAWEFLGWPVHLLGGSPQKQMEIARYLDVRSADGNMAQKLAIRRCQFWTPGTARYDPKNRWWPQLRQGNGQRWRGDDAIYEAFRRSCENIVDAWRRFDCAR